MYYFQEKHTLKAYTTAFRHCLCKIAAFRDRKTTLVVRALLTISLAFSFGNLQSIAQESSDTTAEQPAVFSGPQVGETLPPLIVRGAFEPVAGQEIDPVQLAGNQPLILVFVHDVNRLSISLARAVSQYAHSRAGDRLAAAVILLDDDPTTAEATLKRIRHALTDQVTHAVSIDGREGPGSYGLNRNVTLTILVAKDGKVTANHAIIQPSLQVDLPKILESIVGVIGGPVPKLDDVLESLNMAPANRPARQAAESLPDMRSLLLPLIRKNASDEQVDQAAAEIERLASENIAIKKEIARISTTIAKSDKLENYGTSRTQFYLKKWAKDFADWVDDASGKKATDKKTNDKVPRE
ncbi:MAG TPA: hypothetical protein DDZ51_12845 [Planctomycetaceae bacterium]|nr:hypothetical protein [Planctomycetaceae bacterium]